MYWKRVVYALCFVFVGGIYYLFFKKIVNKLEVFLLGTEYFLTIISLCFTISFYKKKYKLSFVLYIFLLLVFLCFRKRTANTYNFNLYLGDWLKIIDKNETVFINVFGNFVLFIPLTFILILLKLEVLKIIIYEFALVLILEIMQLITRTGVFDIVDVLLNMSGVMIVLIKELALKFRKGLGKR